LRDPNSEPHDKGSNKFDGVQGFIACTKILNQEQHLQLSSEDYEGDEEVQPTPNQRPVDKSV
jgi:hypothetical protein